MSEKQKCRDNFAFMMDSLGAVDLKEPDLDLWLLIDFSASSSVVRKLKFENYGLSPPTLVTPPIHEQVQLSIYFGRLVCRDGMRSALRKFDLKTRLYLGPTSLDHGLAFILANMAQVKKGDFVLDPFVGTGSILLAMSHFGAQCWGTDIDVRVLRGDMYAGHVSRSTKTDLFSNFDQYKLSRPELIRLDNHAFARHYSDCTLRGFFNAIVTDPPYGIRAGGRKSGSKKSGLYTVAPERRHDHIPSTQNYPVNEVMLDLLDAAAHLLVIGGTLCYLIPTPYCFTESDIPQHPCLQLITLAQQGLSVRHGRHAIVMKKTKNPCPESVSKFAAYRHSVMTGQDKHFGELMVRLELALANDAHENEAVVKHASLKSIQRKESKERRKKVRESALKGEGPDYSQKYISKDKDKDNEKEKEKVEMKT